MFIESSYDGRCSTCGKAHEEGDQVWWVKYVKGVKCGRCAPPYAKRPGLAKRPAVPSPLATQRTTLRMVAAPVVPSDEDMNAGGYYQQTDSEGRTFWKRIEQAPPIEPAPILMVG